MPTQVRCPSCGRTCALAWSPGARGVRCPRCSHIFKVKAIGRYQILEELGRGGFGVVYRVFDPRMDREAAVKVLHAEVAAHAGGDSLRRFRNEAKLLAQIVHPNILPLYEADQDEGRLYLVTALIRGRRLDALVPKEGLADPRRGVALVVPLLEALHHVHTTYGICHRDVKPANVMVGEGDALYLMDFGLAVCREQDSARITTDGTTLGTPAFMPPEQAEGDLDHIGPWSDQYSAGVVLYHLLTGLVPFRKPMPAILAEIIASPVPPPSSLRPDLGPDMDGILLRALAKEPQERFRDCREFADQLRDWSQRYTAGTLVTSTPAPQPRRRRSRLWPAFVGALVTAALLAVGGYFVLDKWAPAGKASKASPHREGEKKDWQGK